MRNVLLFYLLQEENLNSPLLSAASTLSKKGSITSQDICRYTLFLFAVCASILHFYSSAEYAIAKLNMRHPSLLLAVVQVH